MSPTATKGLTQKLHDLGLQSRVLLGYPFAALYLIFARPQSLELFFIITALVALGCCLRGWAAGYLVKRKRVAVGGPYAYVRNPLYLGSAIIALGCGLALWGASVSWVSGILWACFLVVLGVIYPAKIKAEERELVGLLNGPYVEYARQVPSFIPWKGRVPNLGSQSFSVHTYLANREYQCLLGSAGILIFLFARYHLGW
ncbi:MAG: isoprenylcysteine carboxylmethyltransferase family protein [Terrimicrobiaceae bacterium]